MTFKEVTKHISDSLGGDVKYLNKVNISNIINYIKNNMKK